jgi:dTDP-L-rhamnose 4-epimerase
MRVLLTGAAGFIGAAVAAELAEAGHEVLPVDAWIPQAHGATGRGKDRVDVRDPDAMREAVAAADVVCHQAAMVGAGVDPADLPEFASHNDLGTAVLLAAMAERRVPRLVLASSMVVYGEGRYTCPEHGDQQARSRRLEDLRAGSFEVGCPRCDRPMGWALVGEDAPLRPRGGYAASKVAQEHYAAAWARQVPAAVVALRYHNVYGPGMPRDTPYSGVAAIFRSALERGERPRVFEDGRQMRDFVHVRDVARANRLAVEAVGGAPEDSFAAYNVCSGQPVAVAEVAAVLAAATGTDLQPVTTGEFRPGDVRHIVAGPERARAELGFAAEVVPADGLRELAHAPLRSPVTSR